MMNSLRDLTIYSKLMLGFCAILAVVIAAEAVALNIGLANTDPSATATANSGDTDQQAIAGPLLIPAIVTYRDIVERPLFSDTRRPQAAPEAAAAATPAAVLNTKWKLTGIVVAGENSSAHVVGIGDKKTLRLQLGTMLDGWRLEKVAADHVEFGLSGRTATLSLHDDEKPKIGPIRR